MRILKGTKDPFAVPSDSHGECCFGKEYCILHRTRNKFSVDKGHDDSVAVEVALVGVRSCRKSEGQSAGEADKARASIEATL